MPTVETLILCIMLATAVTTLVVALTALWRET